MRSRHTMTMVAAAGLALAGCSKDNPYFCPEGEVCADAATVDATPRCETPDDCSAATPACELPAGVCVACTADSHALCTATSPVCSANACRACEANGECESGLCLESGACAAAGMVAFVKVGDAGDASCAQSTPCDSLAKALGTNAAYVVVTGPVNAASSTNISASVEIHGEANAKLTRDGNGATLIIDQSSEPLPQSVSLIDVQVADAHSASGQSNGIGISAPGTLGTFKINLARVVVSGNQGLGISVAGGSLAVTQSTISGNVGGGISVAGATTFQITNNFIFRNGDASNALIGGVQLTFAAAGSNTFDFNTVTDNQIKASSLASGGVVCDTAGFSAKNNIIAHNLVNNNATASNANTLGVCTYATTTIATDLAGLAFASPDSSPFDYHLTAGSSALEIGTTATAVTSDFDGQARPNGGASDRGADELYPTP